MNQNFNKLLLASLCASAIGLSAPLLAQEKQQSKSGTPNVTKKITGSSERADSVALLAAAEQLAQYGEEKKDSLALIAAARIKKDLGEVLADRPSQSQGGQGPDTKAAKSDTSAAALLERAKTFASGRADILALVDEVAKSSTRGAEGGRQRASQVVRGNATLFYNIVFRAGEPAAVALSGDGDTDLDLFVIDEFGNVICRAIGTSDDEICRWTPRFTGRFRIEVRNVGPIANRYALWTN